MKKSKSGHLWYLKNKKRLIEQSKEYHRTHPDVHKRASHKFKYKEPFENKEKRLVEQGGRCANPGCRTTDPGKSSWHTDHDHITKKVRGELCQRCNVALGLLQDDEFKIEGLAQYIRSHKQ